ncbi:hypothetical protein HELRODRAFT_164315 [Helobdella robusta]|uniref:Uncharacterized protein n=1 Tax=Helobdella robusta TaxID=6412 RepID=T1EV92_HELRO|nr:hypothetical protein HELRODRAFT_164315 [Helobdella robusta]ESN94469.1 hypothetical protein HELRODRAFT_164315 [Helobdella robusta]
MPATAWLLTKQITNLKLLTSIAFGILVHVTKIFVLDGQEEIQPLETVFRNHKNAYNKWLIKKNVQLNQDYRFYNENTISEKKFLEKEIQVACFTFLPSRQFENYINSNNESLSGRCNKMFYVGSPDSEIKLTNLSEHVKLSFVEAISWRIMRPILEIIHSASQKYGWYIFNKQNTFFITENFRYLVSVLETSKPYYLGHPVYMRGNKGSYNVLDSGIALNLKAINTLTFLLNLNKCPQNKLVSLDVGLASCLALAGVRPYDTKDDEGRHLFIYQSFNDLFSHPKYFWSRFINSEDDETKFKRFDGPDNVISLLVDDQSDIDVLNFLIYKWISYGVGVPMLKRNGTSFQTAGFSSSDGS